MKIYLDDIRVAPIEYVQCRWPQEVIKLLETNDVSEISLDHDLGNDEIGTGYTVLLWIEEQVFTKSFKPPIIKIHTSNSSAREKMLKAVYSIYNKADM